MDDLLRDFLAESTENLLRLDREIVELEKRPGDPELLKSIFRTVHTIKGTCGFLDLPRLEAVAHAAENVLGRLRDGELDATPAVVSDVLAAVDAIRAILRGLEATGAEPPGDDRRAVERLDRWLPQGESATPPSPVIRLPSRSVEALLAEARPAPAAPPVAESTLRLGVEALDHLVNLAGELVLTRNELVRLAHDDEHGPYAAPLQHLNRVATELQEAVMRTRMQPIGNAWAMLPRLIRDLGRAAGKKIDLVTSGAETELDRQLLQAIHDPLTHIVRNCADHGIETPDVRLAAGKPETGTIRLDARQQGGQIVVEIRDDGRGLDLDAIRSRAVERGLARPEAVATLSDAQLCRFVFEPGFSTAEKVTSISGRGVGMDVVRSNVEAIGGEVELSSVAGEGTTLRLRIPLTLAILPAVVVEAGGERFALPQSGVVELVRLTEENRSLVESVNGARFFRLRESLLPLVPLASLLHLPRGDDDEPCLVVCQAGPGRLGLLVDAIVDGHEVVVKPLGRLLERIPLYTGTTVLGDGRVLMILDLPALAAAAGVAERVESTAPAPEDPAPDPREFRLPLVVFRTGGGAVRAVPLSSVDRLERITPDAVERGDGRYVVRHRGSLLPLVAAAPELDVLAGPARAMIVLTDGENRVGLVVEEIEDVVEDRVRIELTSDDPELLGTAIVAGRSTEILNADSLLRRHDSALLAR